jgi:A/G-specific adenine glycosylase
MSVHAGAFPRNAQQLQTLPGIGRSTAAAIAALCFAERVAILDGNVRRVLTRLLGFAADLSLAANERRLWDLAEQLLPRLDLPDAMPRYTQGLMDLGATVCTVRNPQCARCPLAGSCVALRQQQVECYPVKTRKLKRSSESIWLLWAQTAQGSIWLSKRPSPGVWGALYCFPWFGARSALVNAVPGRYQAALQDAAVFTHALTHKDLFLHPVRLLLPTTVKLAADGAWFVAEEWPNLGLPAPVRKLLTRLSC